MLYMPSTGETGEPLFVSDASSLFEFGPFDLPDHLFIRGVPRPRWASDVPRWVPFWSSQAAVGTFHLPPSLGVLRYERFLEFLTQAEDPLSVRQDFHRRGNEFCPDWWATVLP